jgi:hypothetical protein
MSLETVLTLAVAAVILAIAAVMRLLTYGLVRLYRAITGEPEEWKQPVGARHRAQPAVSWRERSGRMAVGLRTGFLFVTATGFSWLVVLARQLAFATQMTIAGFALIAAWARPWLMSASYSARTHSVAGARKTQAWWRRRMVPSLHRLAIEEAGATWPASRVEDPLSIEGETHRVIRLDDHRPAREKEPA